MNAAPDAPRKKRRKPLNIVLWKSIIVAVAGGVTGLGSALTGLGAQMAFAPMLTWMLGFRPEKAQGTALRYALFASAVAVAAFGAARGLPGGFFWRALLLFIGA